MVLFAGARVADSRIVGSGGKIMGDITQHETSIALSVCDVDIYFNSTISRDGWATYEREEPQ